MMRACIAALLVPGTALAHEGAHLHPHGTEPLTLAVLALAALAAALAWRFGG